MKVSKIGGLGLGILNNFNLKRWLPTAAMLVVSVFFGPGYVTAVGAQSTAESPTQSIADTWQGTLHAGQDLRTVVKISKADAGGYKAVFYSIDQGGAPLPVTKITLEGTTVKMSLTMIGGTYEGKLSADGKTITGNWSQGSTPLPLNFTRATPETEWTIPPPPPKIPPMDVNASPTFEVATIKPSKPDEQGKAFLVRDNRFKTINVTLSEMMSFAYGVHPKQVIGAPAWAGTDKFDIDAKPDGEGAPNDKQWKGMLQYYDYLIGRIDYADQFSVPHWMTFCFFVLNQRGELRACQYGNDEDRNPETPR